MMAMHGGGIVGLLKILRDETGARETAEALERSRAELWQALAENSRARAELEAAGRAKDSFLATLSHELRTPLTAVMAAVYALGLRTDLPDAAHETLEVIRRNIRLEARCIDDLLDLTKVSRGELQLARAPIDLHVVIRSALYICEAGIRARNQHLETALEAPCSRLNGDAQRLQQVIWNVVKNASEFTPPGGNIRLASANDGDRFRLTVTDSGAGIEPHQLAAIFDGFTQADGPTARKYGGSASDLPSVRQPSRRTAARLPPRAPERTAARRSPLSCR